MSFISNSENFTLGEGVYNNIHNNFIHNTFCGKRRHQEAVEEPTHERRRRGDENGIKVVLAKDLKLTLQIGSGAGYLLHTGKAKGRTVVVKVFDGGPTVREVF
ncbi:hypothetical protein DFH09DRAFT_1304392 [Mycena vulgaris]|nr:hypothetical protein DFH09DRAFT_1304392 [Mycena vulgaris]